MWVRSTINTDVGFSREDRRRHLLRAAWVARLLARNGVVLFAAFVSPYRGVRRKVRKIVEDVPFFEVYVKVSLGETMRRDPKGLYKRALAGEVKNFTGVDDPYEEPEAPDLVLVNEEVSVEVNIEREFLASRGCYKPHRASGEWGGRREVSARLEVSVGAQRGRLLGTP